MFNLALEQNIVMPNCKLILIELVGKTQKLKSLVNIILQQYMQRNKEKKEKRNNIMILIEV